MEDSAEEQRENLDPAEEGKPSAEELAEEKDRWQREFAASKKWLEPLKSQAKKIEAIIRDERAFDAVGESHWNLFAANRETKAAMLYGRPPRVSVDRRFADEADDVARVAGDITTRLLNTDIERTSDGYSTALMLALLDRLDSGWSMVCLRYVVEWEDVAEVAAKMGVDPATGQPVEVAPAVPAGKRKKFEDVETDYVHLEDQLWQPSRTHSEMGWWSKKNQMSKDEVTERFGEEIAASIPYDGKPPVMAETWDNTAGGEWKRADVWEIYDKDRKKVIWYVENWGVLDCKPDPYGLEGFYPFPRPMVANPTSSKYQPRPDYVIAQDLYTELNLVTTRIKHIMEKGVRVTGAYDAKYKELGDITSSSGDGVLLPVQNWSMTGEGIQAAVWIFPTQEMVNCVLQLRDYRRELIDAIAQVTGMADIMRGEATQAGATATEQNLKAVMGSVRMRAVSIDFARFASEAQNIRAQLMAKFFDAETIAQRSNAKFLPKTDEQFVAAAIQLIKSPGFSQYRIEVKSEALSLENFAQIKSERFDAAASIGQLLNATAPLMQAMPGAAPMVFKMGQALLAGMPGASGMESAFDSGLKAAEAQAQQQTQQGPPPDPKLQAEQAKQQTVQMKGQVDLQKEQVKAQLAAQQTQIEVQADAMREENQRQSNVHEFAQRQAIAAAYRPEKPTGHGGVP